jgi:acetyl/propionyl-CoA carboxylase alpha subunit
VAKGDKLLTLEAMKMQTTIYAPADGVVDEICVAKRRRAGEQGFDLEAARGVSDFLSYEL